MQILEGYRNLKDLLTIEEWRGIVFANSHDQTFMMQILKEFENLKDILTIEDWKALVLLHQSRATLFANNRDKPFGGG